MQALLRLSLLIGMLIVDIGMIRHALSPDRRRLQRISRWLRGLGWTSVLLLLLWLIHLAR